MIITKQRDVNILSEGSSVESINMSLDMDSANILMSMLSKNLYSDPIGSTVRETASNALDSHRKAGVTDAIIISLKINTEDNYEFSVEDFGVGLDNNDIENIISKYGNSTKRNSDEFIGAMGLGFKSPLSYNSVFYFTCRKNGIERKYLMSEGEDVNTIDLLFETPTVERDGVKVIVPVKYNDIWTFHEKIKNQLAYFESVYFDVNVKGNIISNEFSIHRAENFQLSELNMDNYMHICLDNVYYPIDFSKLGIQNMINLPIGLRFGLSDGLFPTPNREQLIYSSTTKKKILDKIEQVATDLVEMYNVNSIDCKDIHEIFQYYASTARNITIGNNQIDTARLSAYTKTIFRKPEYENYKITDFAELFASRDYMFYEYKVGMNYVRGQFRQTSGYWNTNLNYKNSQNTNRIWTFDEPLVGNKKSYIKSLLPVNDYNEVMFLRKSKHFNLKGKDRNYPYDNYMTMLKLNRYPKETWRARIIEFQSIVKELTMDFRDADTTDIPQAWLDAKKKKRVTVSTGTGRRVKLEGEINFKVAEELQRYVHGKSSKLSPGVLKVADISSAKFLHVYGKAKDEALIDQLYSVSSKQKIKYFVLSEREHKVVETLDIHNLISIEKFMEGKNAPFRRIVTGYLIDSLMSRYSSVFTKTYLLESISASLKAEIDVLIEYSNLNHRMYGDTKIYEAMLVIAEEHNLFDETIYTEYRQLKSLLDNFPFIETTMEILPAYTNKEWYERYLNVLSDLFKYNRLRVDYTNYHLRLNEDISEEVLTEEIINELEANN